MGARGRGTPEHHGVIERVDILTGTLGKALGGASGGYSRRAHEIVELLRQRSRPYLFSNSLAPLDRGRFEPTRHRPDRQGSHELRDRLRRTRAALPRGAWTSSGSTSSPASHPIVPVMVGDAAQAARLAEQLVAHGVYVVGFSFPVVPRGTARIRTQMSAAHTPEDLDFAVAQFAAVRAALEATPRA